MRVVAFTVSVAGLLVILPAGLVTVTVNCSFVFPVVVAGVVYEEEVAQNAKLEEPQRVPQFFSYWHAKP